MTKQFIKTVALSLFIFLGFALIMGAENHLLELPTDTLSENNNVIALANNNLASVRTDVDLHQYADLIVKEHTNITNIDVTEKSIVIETLSSRDDVAIPSKDNSYTTEVAFNGNNGVDVLISSYDEDFSQKDLDTLKETIEHEAIIPANTEITPYAKALLIRAAVVHIA